MIKKLLGFEFFGLLAVLLALPVFLGSLVGIINLHETTEQRIFIPLLIVSGVCAVIAVGLGFYKKSPDRVDHDRDSTKRRLAHRAS